METKNYKSFIALLEEIDKEERTQRDRGTLFELLVLAYLQKEPTYARLFDKVWKLSDVPDEYNIPKKDTGVDLVAKEKSTGDLVAIQCKFHSRKTRVRKEHIDSFLNEVGKSYYSRGIIVTSTDDWSINAEEALDNRDKDIQRIGLSHFYESKVDWSEYSFTNPNEIKTFDKKTPRPHQIPAINAVIEGFKKVDRGKLIMAPGTGKTYTSMAIAEEMANEKNGVFRVLYLVPSIQLLSQTLRGWNDDIRYDMSSIAVCSDRKVTKNKGNNELEDIAASDIGYPATTSYEKLLEYKKKIEENNTQTEFLTVFSTYQSIDVIIEAQKQGFYEFDLVVCDEAHRTTGKTELNKEESSFTKVHSDSNIKAAKRLYQTATPRVYGEDAKTKAKENSVIIADMNDSEIYGEEFYRIGFGDAVRNGILTDYKVMILAVDEEVVAKRFQKMLANEKELHFDDVTKIIGCWNGLVKRKSNSDEVDGKPMKRAIAFTGTIKESKLITNMFQQVVDEYLYETDGAFSVEVQHADGSMNALQKNEKIAWLKSDVPDNTCRILSNARFLTEGVDIPDLDAVMFLKPRKSKIDIAQAVGRVMRKADDKEYGYVILPIGIPAGVDENSVLDENKNYSVVWEVLNALRSLDERFDSMINKLELNKKKPSVIGTTSVGDAPRGGLKEPESYQMEADLSELTDLENAIYGKIVRKVGNVRYWEDWSKDVAEIAQQHMMRIRVMIEDTESQAYQEFQNFLKSLRYNINDSISETQAIEMLAQHLITKPVFEALFESYSFVHNNPVSRAMESILSVLDKQGLLKEQDRLESFYESVRVRAEGVDNLEGKQKIIIQLYDKFFRVGFKETTERLGIVFTPVEVVDFIINSMEDVLNRHFNKSLTSEGVHILEPFIGTGTFVTRLLQSGIISKGDLLRKYTQEIHANEIVLLSYYIAAINIEETFHSIYGGEYLPFEGIVLTDTFESTENRNSFDSELFNVNNSRLKKQQEQSIFAIMGNPPYFVGQSNENDNNTNKEYPILDSRIAKTYAKYSKAKMKKTLYDSFIRAYRWATDRLGDKGIIGFVSNGSFMDSQATDGLRKCWFEEFNYIYVFNLRGDARTSKEQRRKEAGNIFGEGSRTSVAITIMVKDGSDNHQIFYHDIGDYLSKNDKLNKIKEYNSINSIDWDEIVPDQNNDWLNQRNENYLSFKPMYSEVGKKIFNQMMIGVTTSRDAWVYGFSKDATIQNAERMVENYNSEIERLKVMNEAGNINLVNSNSNFINWSRALKKRFEKSQKILMNRNNVILSQYRPFCKKWLYYEKDIVEMPGRYHNLDVNNADFKYIHTLGLGSKKDFSVIMGNKVPNFHLMDTGKVFLTKVKEHASGLISEDCYSNISDEICNEYNLSKEDMFYFVYGILHSPEYKETFRNDLAKEIPRVPNVSNKDVFIEAGRKLAELHLNYEKVEPYTEVKIEANSQPTYKVERMKHPKKGKLDEIIFNSSIRVKSIPLRDYDYVVSGKSAIEWIMEQYQVKTDKASGITDDPNEYSDDEKYIFNLLLRIINVSVQTVDLVNSLPPIEIEE
ncbi:DEAD/DEAH box helicase [Pseudobacillus badius]|uniref:DEAD/DEAH box helicase n=1 Tax=Bacillus badius TaxID=1455 RepID=UPI0007B3810C|nr:type ISP restriction/modification enzyme [Bacillus badius]KZR58957.1 helicase [Bacillus badius]